MWKLWFPYLLLGYPIEQLEKSSDIILVQEHWYFDCQLNKLDTVCDTLMGVGKKSRRHCGSYSASANTNQDAMEELVSCRRSPLTTWWPVSRMERIVFSVFMSV